MKASSSRRSSWLGWLAFWLAVAVFFTTRSIQRSDSTTGDGQSWLVALAWNVPGFLLWGLFSLAIERLRRRFPLDGRRRRNLYLHAAVSIAVAPTHLLLLGAALDRVNRIAGDHMLVRDFSSSLPVFFHLNLLVYWMIVLGGEALAYGRRVREQVVATARLEGQLAEARLSALRMQLHPHFLFNTLNSIAELMHIDLAAAEHMTLRLSGLLRTALQTASDHVVPLEEELEFLERYLEVEKVRFHDRLSIRLEIDPLVLRAPVPALVLQPLAENSVRHGIGRLPGGGEIVVRASRESGHVVLEVVNDAPPASAAAPAARRSGVGLANTRDRLSQLFGAEASLQFGRDESGRRYRVRIELPLERPQRARDPGRIAGSDSMLFPGRDEGLPA